MSARDRKSDDGSLLGGAAARTARLASLPLGFAGRATVGVGRRLAGQSSAQVSSDLQRRTAEQLFSVLGELKGGAMKVGQALSVFEAAMPDDLVGPYRETLTKLQDSAPPMDEATVHGVLDEALGRDWRDRLELGPDPAAAASIGQVHHGRWHDGREVAVKVQYPGADRALRSDLRQLARLGRMFSVLAPGVDVKGLLTELQDRAVEELDYELEAEAQRVFAAAFAGDPAVLVPEVVEAAPTVLITTWMPSRSSLARLIVDGTQAERDHYGEAYVRFLLTGPRRTGLLHADPHPGNFRVLEDGRLGVIDYGAVARLEGGTLPPAAGRILRHAVDDDYDGVVQGLRDEGFLRPGAQIDTEVLRSYLEPFVVPARTPTFSFSREWLREQANRVSALSEDGLGTALKINLPREYLLIHRVWAGGMGVLCQLGATAPFAGIIADALPGFADDSSSTA